MATIDMALTEGGCCAPFAERWEPVEYKCCAEVYFCSKWCLHPSSHLATIDVNRKLGTVVCKKNEKRCRTVVYGETGNRNMAETANKRQSAFC